MGLPKNAPPSFFTANRHLKNSVLTQAALGTYKPMQAHLPPSSSLSTSMVCSDSRLTGLIASRYRSWGSSDFSRHSLNHPTCTNKLYMPKNSAIGVFPTDADTLQSVPPACSGCHLTHHVELMISHPSDDGHDDPYPLAVDSITFKWPPAPANVAVDWPVSHDWYRLSTSRFSSTDKSVIKATCCHDAPTRYSPGLACDGSHHRSRSALPPQP